MDSVLQAVGIVSLLVGLRATYNFRRKPGPAAKWTAIIAYALGVGLMVSSYWFMHFEPLPGHEKTIILD